MGMSQDLFVGTQEQAAAAAAAAFDVFEDVTSIGRPYSSIIGTCYKGIRQFYVNCTQLMDKMYEEQCLFFLPNFRTR